MSRLRRLAVLISGSGWTNLQALIDACASGAIPHTKISLVFSNRKAAYGLTRAAQASISTAYLALQPFLKVHADEGATRDDYDEAIAWRVRQEKPDVIVLAGWMHVLGVRFLEIIEGKKGDAPGQQESTVRAIPVINLHPALPGAFDGANAIQRAFEAFQRGEIKKSGAMVHRVVLEVDRGEPVVVREIEFREGETRESFEERLHATEWAIIVEATKKVLDEVVPLGDTTSD
ncbi:phosphoribosylglycinamide formyltransferase [Ramaria rubella]|nr:phosphoribosylglycinamide formyltransferase [Ramaria rubella]